MVSVEAGQGSDISTLSTGPAATDTWLPRQQCTRALKAQGRSLGIQKKYALQTE